MQAIRVLVATLALAACWFALGAAGEAGSADVSVRLIALNDLHGHLEPHTSGTVGGEPAGGAEYLASHVRRLAAGHPGSLVVAAGDLVGGSPLISAHADDRPAIEALNRIGLAATALGNHELDRGVERLRDHVRQARFPFLSANLLRANGRPLLAPFAVRRTGGVRIGLIGATVRDTPAMVPAPGIAGLRFGDEADAINRAARALRRRGVRALVVLLHEGGLQRGHENDCRGLSGPLARIVRRTVRDVDVFVTGHTHDAYRCEVDGRLVTSAGSYGRLLTAIDLRVDRRTGDVLNARARNEVVTQDVAPAADMAALVQRYRARIATVADRPIGALAAAATRRRTPAGESPLGALVADAQQAAGDSAVAAFVNPGALRSDLPEGVLTYGEAFTALPFERRVVTATVTGALLLEALKAQWCGRPSPTILTPSASVSYAVDAAAAIALAGEPCAGAAAPVHDLRIAGDPVAARRRYRIAVTEELAAGRDHFDPFARARKRRTGPPELAALETHLRGSGIRPAVRAAPQAGRIRAR